MVPWNGAGGGTPAEMVGVERQASAHPVLWPPAIVGMQSNGNGACESAVRVGCRGDGRGSQVYAWCGCILIVSTNWVATACVHVDALYLFKLWDTGSQWCVVSCRWGSISPEIE